MTIFYNDDYANCGYAFDTTRKSANIAESLVVEPIHGVEVSDPSYAYGETDELIARIHDKKYVEAVLTGKPRNLAESQGFEWDPNIYRMARAHNAGIVAAVHRLLHDGELWSGSLSSGLHHATASMGGGFCTFNGLAVGAKEAMRLGAERILILDFDAHCGGGTNSMVGDSTVQLDISTSSFDAYAASGESRLQVVEQTETFDEDYIETVKGVLDYADTLGPWDLVIYNSGMDPFNTGIGYETLVHREYAVADWVQSTRNPTLFTIAGGYTWGSVTDTMLVDLHRLTIKSFADIVDKTI